MATAFMSAEDDRPTSIARRQSGRDAIVGVTCHDSRQLAMEAAEIAGADLRRLRRLLSIRHQEPNARPTRPAAILVAERWTVPCVAIGGITVETAPVVMPT